MTEAEEFLIQTARAQFVQVLSEYTKRRVKKEFEGVGEAIKIVAQGLTSVLTGSFKGIAVAISQSMETIKEVFRSAAEFERAKRLMPPPTPQEELDAQEEER